MNPFLSLKEIRLHFSPYGPLFASLVPWGLVLIASAFPLCGIIKTGFSSFYLIILGNMFAVCLIAATRRLHYPGNITRRNSSGTELQLTDRFRAILRRLMVIFLLMEALQIIYFRGFPLYWLVIGDSRTYADFGIKSINGLLNAIYLFSTTAMALLYFSEPRRKYIYMICFLLFIPVLLISRQLLISVFLQITCCYLFYYPKSIRKIAIFAGIILGSFIWIGNYRTGLNRLVQILEPYEFVPEFLHPFLWIYAYLLTPFNNLNATIDRINPLGFPGFEFNQLLPSTLRSFIPVDISNTGFALVHSNMTVSTFYFEPLLDFGSVYAFLFMMLFQYFLLRSFWNVLTTRSPVHLIEYSVYYMIMVLSVFSNLFLYLPVIFQLVLINMLKLVLRRKSGVLILSLKRDF